MSSHTQLNRLIIETLARHPIAGAVIWVAAGAFMTRNAILEGTRMQRFVGGPRVVGSVVELRPAHYEMTAGWRDPNGNDRRGTVALYRDDVARLQPNTPVDLRLAATDYADAMLAANFERADKPITLFGVAATPMVFFGLICILVGLFWRPIAKRAERELA
jgi:hypothetical protein